MLGLVVAVAVPVRGDLAAEADLDRIVIARDEPALGREAPVVGDLGLAAVGKLLLENTELIADGISRGLHAERGHAVHIAGGKTAQAAVAEARIGLGLKNVRGVLSHVLQRADKRLGNAEVEGVLHQAAAHEEFHGHVMYFFFLGTRAFDREQAAHDLADHHRRGLEDLVVGGGLARHGKIRAEAILYRASQLVKFVSSEICLAVCFARGSPFWAPAGLS